MLKRYGEYPGMFAMWQAAQLAIAESEELVVFGFSFPKTDLMIRQLFRQALSSKRLRYVAIIDPNAFQVQTEFAPLVPPGVKVEYELLPAPIDNSTPKWFLEAQSSAK